MKLIRRIFGVIVVVLVLISAAIFYYFNCQRPDYGERLDLEGLTAAVDIYYDQYGIPHIYGESTEDVYLALGYVHAKDRLWQMELLRRVAPGQLSEILGEASIETDKFFRTLDIAHNTAEAVKRFDAEGPEEIRSKVTAYLNGVNQYVNEGQLPIEYHILGVKRRAFTLEDVYNISGYMAFSFAMAHKTEPIATQLLQELGPEYLNDLSMEVDTSRAIIASEIRPELGRLSGHIDKLVRGLPVAQFIGSNSWVLAPSKTSTGGVIFANDPHIGFSQPAVWYEAHLEAPGYSLYGNFIGGLPIAFMGHTRHHAIGVTMFENDDIDLYQEQLDEEGRHYYQDGHLLPLEIRKETISVKGSDDVVIEVRKTHHGSIISDVARDFEGMSNISMFWVYQNLPIHTLEAAYKIMHASSLSEAQVGAAMISSPGLNIMYGDVDGNIAWWAAAKLPKRPPGATPKLIMDGSTTANDITEYYPFKDNPQSINPSWGYVYSANNQSVSATGIAHEGYYLGEDRGRRIQYLLDQKSDWNTEDVKAMITDVVSLNAPEIAQQLITYQRQAMGEINEIELQALEWLSNWDGSHEVVDIAPTIYYKWLYHTMDKIMRDEVGDGMPQFLETHLIKRSIQPLIANHQSRWWDDRTTETIETPPVIVSAAFSKTISELEQQLGKDVNQWKWGKVHSLEHPHVLGANDVLKPYFNVGPFYVHGSREVINNLDFDLSADGTYEALSGPSCRRVINLSRLDTDNWSILPTGQSGNRWSPYYQDQASMYNSGQFRRQLMNEEEIKKVSAHQTIMRPK